MELQLRRNEIIGSGTNFFSNVLYISYFCLVVHVLLFYVFRMCSL